MADIKMQDAIAFLAANAELLSDAIKVAKDGTVSIDTEAAEKLSVRGDALVILERKTTFSADARGAFVDTVFQMTEDYVAGMKKDGTKATNRFGFDTPSGYKVTVTVEKITEAGGQS